MHYSSPPVLLRDLVDDLDAVRSVLTRNAPYRPLGGWFRSGATAEAPTLPLWFQKDWVHANLQVAGSEIFLHHPRVIAAAKQFYAAEVVVPHTIYVNVMGPIANHGPAHTDNPLFSGLDRTSAPMHVLRSMLWSGLFDQWAVKQATSIWWLNDVSGGGLLYWPEGPDRPPARHEHHMANTALVGDNHGMFHQVAPVGDPVLGEAEPPLVTSTAELAPDTDDQWTVTDQGAVVWRAPLERYRVSVLWKANVYTDEAERRRIEANPIGLDDVIAIFNDDLAHRGETYRLSRATLADLATRDALKRFYPESVPVAAGA